MTNTPAYIVTKHSITVCFDGGKMLTIDSTHPEFSMALAALKEGKFADLQTIMDRPKVITAYTNGKISVVGGVVQYNGTEVHNYVTNKILDFMEQQLPYQPLCLFLENLMQNPSHRSVEQLFQFLENGQMPITDDGHFLAYKSVRADYKDHHSGKFDNSIGKVIEMSRNQVSDDADQGCGPGLHAGSLSYASSFGSGDRVLIIVKINPKDVVSVPKDHSYQKLRCCRYEVVGPYTGPMPDTMLNQHQYTSGDYEDDYEEEEEEMGDEPRSFGAATISWR